MKTICLIALITAVALLTGCADIWMTIYRAKGGYYDRDPKPVKRTQVMRDHID